MIKDVEKNSIHNTENGTLYIKLDGPELQAALDICKTMHTAGLAAIRNARLNPYMAELCGEAATWEKAGLLFAELLKDYGDGHFPFTTR